MGCVYFWHAAGHGGTPWGTGYAFGYRVHVPNQPHNLQNLQVAYQRGLLLCHAPAICTALHPTYPTDPTPRGILAPSPTSLPPVGFGIWGLWFRVWVLGSGVWGLGSGVRCLRGLGGLGRAPRPCASRTACPPSARPAVGEGSGLCKATVFTVKRLFNSSPCRGVQGEPCEVV